MSEASLITETSPATKTSPTTKVSPNVEKVWDSTKVPNLTCEIHPMFAYENWLCLSEEDYDLIRPTLQLTTMLLGTPASLAFYATLLFGERAYYSEKDCDEMAILRIDEESPLTQYKADTITDMFDDLTGLYKFTFQKIEPTGQLHATRWVDMTDAEREDLLWQRSIEQATPWSARKSLKHGLTVDKLPGPEKEFCWESPPDDTWDDWPSADQEPTHHIQDPRTRMTPATIVLSAKLFTELKSQRHVPAHAIKNAFQLARVILHELAHAVESGRPERRLLHWYEPVFPGETHSELGHQYEKHLFGFCPYPMDLPDDYWLYLTGSSPDEAGVRNARGKIDWPGFYEWPLRSTSEHFMLPLGYMAALQRQETWDAVVARGVDLGDQRAWHLPRNLPIGRESSAWYSSWMLEGFLQHPGGKEWAATRYAVFEDEATVGSESELVSVR